MKVVFMGTADFALPALENIKEYVSLVVSQPDRPSGRGSKLKASPISEFAIENNLKLERPEKCRAPEFVERLKEENADLFVVAAYGQILPQRILDIPKHGCINLHGSLLPRWRGAAPVQRCIEAGDTVSGVTLMLMDKGMDTGDMIALEETQIGEHEVAGELYSRLSIIAGEMITSWLPKLVTGDFKHEKQDDSLATLAPKVTKEDGILDWEQPLQESYNQFRAFTPVPGASLLTTFGSLKVHDARPAKYTGVSGTVLSLDEELVVAIGDGSLSLRTVQLPGKKRVSGLDFANGARLEVGNCLKAKDENDS